jgi:CBS domain-containing protein
MSCPIVGIEERRPLTEAADLMNKHQTHHLGVTKGGAVGPSPSAICFVLSPSTNSSRQPSLPTSPTPRLLRTRWGRDGILCLPVLLIWSAWSVRLFI